VTGSAGATAGSPAGMPPVGGAAYRAVLVPVDGSALAERALAPAAWLARRFGAALHHLAARVSRDRRWWYERYAAGLVARLPGSTAHLRDDHDVAGAILATARDLEPCLVCMATHGRSRQAALVGSTFAAVARRGAVPLLTVGPRAAVRRDAAAARIVVCLDGHALAEQALPLAAAWARRLDLRISLIIAADPILIAPDDHTGEARYGSAGDAQAYVDEVAARPVLGGLSVDAQVLWGLGYPRAGIGESLDRRPAALVVTTSHARRGLARAAFGSEAAGIVRRSPAPVLVQPARLG
jgi:nucleotide-binding universal stress UspA family protein